MDSIADSGTGGDAPNPITGASTDREDEDAGMDLLADGRRRREPQTITRPVPVLIRPAQAATSGTLTRPCDPSALGEVVVIRPAPVGLRVVPAGSRCAGVDLHAAMQLSTPPNNGQHVT